MATGIPANSGILKMGVAAVLFLLLAQPEQQDAQISVKVDLVVVYTTVRDKKGQFAADLTKKDFQVYEDGVRQAIRVFQHEDSPVTVGLVIDHSGSMQHKMPEVIEAARTFIRSSGADDQMFVVNFNEKVTLGLPALARFSNRPDELVRAIAQTGTVGQTALYDAIAAALTQLQSAGPSKRVLVVISDGGDNRSLHSLDDVLKMAGQTSTLIYTVGIFEPEDLDRNPGVLRNLARSTGGDAYFPRALTDVVGDCERIAHDIRHQYAIGYSSRSATLGPTHHSIRVTAAAPDHRRLIVRARSSYLSPGAK